MKTTKRNVQRGSSLREPDAEERTGDSSRWMRIGLAWMVCLAVFAWLPDTFLNWGYDYLAFLPPVATALAVGLGALVLWGPVRRLLPGAASRPCVRAAASLVVLFALPTLFWVFRTRIHCFCGDGCVGTVMADTTFRLADFIPPLPGVGRLDCWGMGPLTKVLLRSGVLNGFTGMTVRAVSQVYAVIFGALYVAFTLLLFRRSAGAVCALLSFPSLFNFFGNIDCYAFSLCMVVLFAAALASCDARGTSLSVPRLCAVIALWLVGLWTHPSFVFGGFPIIPLVVRCANRLQKRMTINALFLQALFAAVLFTAISLSPHAKTFFDWPVGGRPPVFSTDTFIHLLNVLILPIAPLALVVWHGAGERAEKRQVSATFVLMCLCFLPLGFTLGADDQFLYMLFALFFAIPWILAILSHEPSGAACRFLLAANLFLLVPMVAVHSSDRTVARAEALYPKDPCKHNAEMSWQTHLGLLLADNLIDSPKVKEATLRTFANGARHAEPPSFRAGNLIYHTAFLYHFGEFEQGRKQLFSLLNQDVGIIRMFLNDRPGFIYCNRKRLWDDIDLFLSQRKSPLLGEYRKIVQTLRQKVAEEPFCLKYPAYAETE